MKKEKNGSGLLIVLMIIMIILMACAFVGLFLMMRQANEMRDELNEIKETNGSKQEVSKDENKPNTSTKCKSVVGAYYAEVNQGNLHMKQTYSFSEDGSFITYVENGGGANGTYTLTNGTIYFTQKPELGPSNETVTYFYEVSDDCKTIYVSNESLTYELKRIEQ